MNKTLFKLIINTNSYSGNFKRELIAYVFGRLANDTNSYTAFVRPFWDKVVGTGVETYENYKKIISKDLDDDLNLEHIKLIYIKRGFDEEEAIKKTIELKEKIQKKNNETNISYFYDEFLCFTNQLVDDLYENTFYNIFNYDNDDYNAIYIQLNKPFNEYFENIIIHRIINFFETDAYNKIKTYEWFCRGYDFSPEEPFVLKDLVLVDENGNIVKDYLNTKE